MIYDNSPRPIDVGRRIREERERQGKTQVELATAAGIGQSALSAIERGDTKKPEAVTILRVAVALKTSPYILLWDHEMPQGVERTMSRLIDLWHHLDDEARAKLLAYAEGLFDAGMKRPRPPKQPPSASGPPKSTH